MFTFSLLVSIAQDKDLELSYCIPSVRIIGSSRIVVISQDTTIGSDPFLPQLDLPTVEPEVITVDENLNTPPPPSVTPEYSQAILAKLLHPYLEADICLDTESKQILQTPSSPLDKDPPLTDLGPIDPDIFASPPPKKRKRQTV